MAKVNLFSNANRQPGTYETSVVNVPTKPEQLRESIRKHLPGHRRRAR